MSAPKTAAYQMLMRSNITQLPITYDNIQEICDEHGWSLRSYAESADIIDLLHISDEISGRPGMSYMSDDAIVILYDGSMSNHERLFVIAHEIGHIVLKHTGQGIVGKSNNPLKDSLQEQEADNFAYNLLAPPCVLKKCRARQKADLRNLTNLANIHIEKFLSCMYEDDNEAADITTDRLLERFSVFIRQYQVSKYSTVIRTAMLTVSFVALLLLPVFVRWLNSGDKPLHVVPDESQPYSDSSRNSTSKSSEVFVTVTGDKYHLKDCMYLRGRSNVQKMTEQEAISEGYGACKVCDP